MADQSKEPQDTMDAIGHFLSEKRKDPPPEAFVLEEMGDFNAIQVVDDKQNGSAPSLAYGFAHEVVEDKARLAAVVTINNAEQNKLYLDAMAKLDSERRARLLEQYGVELLGFDIKYKDMTLKSGLVNLDEMDLVEDYDEDEIYKFKLKFDQIPKEAQEAIRDYSEWVGGEGKYTGNTGKEFEACLAAKFLTKEDYEKIIKAREAGQKIIGTPDGLSASTEFKFWNSSNSRWEKIPTKKIAWAIVPLNKSQPLEQLNS